MIGRRAARLFVAAVVSLFPLTACSGEDEAQPVASPTPSPVDEECGGFSIAYDPSNGYEASAFIVGQIAEQALECKVTYVRTSSRHAWQLVADGRADVYLDAYGSDDRRPLLVGPGKPVTIVGRNGIVGGVDLLAPYFMRQDGLETFRELDDDDIGWGTVTPAITTVGELVAVAQALIDNVGIDYVVRDYREVGIGDGMRDLLRQATVDNQHGDPGLYLAAAPKGLMTDTTEQFSVVIPDSAGEGCVPTVQSTTCSLEDFPYLKIANADFAASGSPAYSLVVNYRLTRPEVDNVLEIVQLSGYDVRAADVASWVNTHEEIWSAWLA